MIRTFRSHCDGLADDALRLAITGAVEAGDCERAPSRDREALGPGQAVLVS